MTQWYHPTISSSVWPLLLLTPIFLTIRVFSHKSGLHIRWPKYWSFSFSIGPSNEYSGFISFSMDWFVLLAVQGTLKSLLQYNSSKASILRHSALFMVQLSHPYMTIGKTIALTFVGKGMSLFLNMPSRVCHVLSSKEQVSFNFMAAVTICSDFGSQENKICHCFHFFTNISSVQFSRSVVSDSLWPPQKKLPTDSK